MTLEAKLDTLIELQTQTNTLLRQAPGEHATVDTTPSEVKKTTKKRRTKAEIAAEKAAKEEAATASTEDDIFGDEETTETVGTTESQMTHDDIEDELRALVKNKKGPMARTIFTKYGAKTITEIKDGDINKVYAELKAANDE